MRLTAWIALFTVFWTSSYADEVKIIHPVEKVSQVPNPLALTEDWWDYFKVDNKLLPKRIDQFSKSLDELVKNSPKGTQVKIRPLVTKIKTNLYAYLLAKTQTIEPPPPITPIKKSYTVDEVVKLNRHIRNSEILLQSDQENFNEKERHIKAGREEIRKLESDYDAAKDRSEEKLIAGLRLMNFQISLQLAEIKQTLLEHELKVEKELINRQKAELTAAKETVTSNQQELLQKEKDFKQAENEWRKKSLDLRRQEAQSLSVFDFSQKGDVAKLQNGLLELKLLNASIEEALALNQKIVNRIELEWVQYLNSPIKKEFQDLDKNAEEWNNDINQLNQKVKDWEISINRDIQRAQEWLSINVDVSNEESKTIQNLQEQILQMAEQSLVLINQLKNEIQDSEFLLSLVNKAIAAHKGGYKHLLSSIWDSVTEIYNNVSSWVTQPWFQVGKTVINAWSIIKFILVILISIWIARTVRALIHRFAMKRQGVRLSLIYRVNRLFQYFIIVIGVIIAMTVIGFNFSNFVLIAGALGVGLGFGLQALFNNFVSGLVILFENQLKVGDYIELESGVIGEIKEINVRSTYVKTNDGIAVMIPNSELTSSRVINWTHKEPFRRIQVHFGVAYGSDKEKVKEVVMEAVLNVPVTLKKSWVPEPKVFMESMGESSLNFIVSVWVDDAATKRSTYTKSMYLWAIHDALIQNDIKIPFPQMDLHVENMLDKKTFKELMDDYKQNS